MDRAPFAASVRQPDPDRESFDTSDSDMEDPMLFPQSDLDEQARQGRLNAPPMPRTEVSLQERARLIVGCADAVLAWRGVYGAADSLIRGLADRLGVPAGEAEALVLVEQARRR